MRIPLLLALVLSCVRVMLAQDKVIRLYDGPAPGSESWTHSEKEAAKTSWGGPVVYMDTAETRPDFVAPIYLAYNWTLKDRGVPADAPPMFILAATDDPLGLAPQSADLYRDWTAAKKPAELHLFARGGHGFGMNHQDKPTDGWIERFGDWPKWQGLLEK